MFHSIVSQYSQLMPGGDMDIGYIRVSSVGQNTERQLQGLQLEKVFTDHVSGKDKNRPALLTCLGFVREGDILHVHSIDRLARNLKDLPDGSPRHAARKGRDHHLPQGKPYFHP